MKTNLIGISGKIGSGKDTVGKVLQMLNQGIDSDKQIIDYINGANITGFDYQIKKYADKLKDIVCLLIGCTREQLEDREFKEKELGEEWWYYGAYQHGSHYDILESIHINKKDAEYILEYSHMNRIELIKLTPRKLLQLLGTDCGRQIIHPNIWINALFADYNYIPGNRYHGDGGIKEPNRFFLNWIITDVRFPNEAQAIKERGGIVIRVNRDSEQALIDKGIHIPKHLRTKEHPSETALDDYEFDHVIENNGSIEELVEKVKQLNLVQ